MIISLHKKIKTNGIVNWITSIFGVITGIIISLMIILVVLNEPTNMRTRVFSDDFRLEKAKQQQRTGQLGDSVFATPGEHYLHSDFYTLFFGKHYREIWASAVKVKTWKPNVNKLRVLETGGGQQTANADIINEKGRVYTLRSVNKDQSGALPDIFKGTFVEVFFRDQASALNPYGGILVPELAKAAGVLNTTPELRFVPYNENIPLLSQQLAGRIVLLEQHPDPSWRNSELFDGPEDIVSTEQAFSVDCRGDTVIDRRAYLKARLFDMLISDWDRHEGQWEWGLYEDDIRYVFRPIAKDRDMAFCKFNDGLINKIILAFVPKLQSFTKDYGNVKGYMINSMEMDKRLLKNIDKETWILTARELDRDINIEVIRRAFENVPKEVRNEMVNYLQEKLVQRKSNLTGAALVAYQILNK